MLDAGHFICLLLVTAWLSLGQTTAAEVDTCSTAPRARAVYDEVNSRIGFDEERRVWYAKQATKRVDLTTARNAAQLLKPLLGNRRLLFVGDSTTRNPVATLVSMLCNDHFNKCDQVASWFHTQRETSFKCRSGDPSNTCRSSVAVYQVPIENLTADEMPTKEARKAMWIAGVLPPMARAIIPALNLTIDVVEAGCSSRDSTWKVLGKLLDAPSHVEKQERIKLLLGNSTVPPQSPTPPDAPFLKDYDAVVVGGGMHCTYKHFSQGWWYHTLKNDSLRYIAPRTPVVYIELTRCLKFAKKPSSKSLVHCPFVDQVVGDMMAALTSVPGVFMAPTRGITANITLMKNLSKALVPEDVINSPCPFSDALHPSLACYPPIVMSIAMTVHEAIKHVEQLRRNASWQKCFVMPTRVAAGAPTASSPSLSVVVSEEPTQAQLRVTRASTTDAAPPKGTSSTTEQPAADQSPSRHIMNPTASAASDPVTAALAVAIGVAALAVRHVLERKPTPPHELPHVPAS